MLQIGTILHPTDFSPRSAEAFEIACSLARDYGARLIVLNVLVPPVAPSGTDVAIPAFPLEDEKHAAQERMRQLQPAVANVPVEYQVKEGDPAAVILQVAEQAGCDLIVMGTHGRTGLARLLMGSVSEQVVRKGPCPVLTIKTPHPDEPPAE